MTRPSFGLCLLSLSLACARPSTSAPPAPLEVVTVGEDEGRGAVVAISPWWTGEDYASEERFAARVDEALAAAQEAGLLAPGGLAVLPEYVGTWLVAVDEDQGTWGAPTVSDAMTALALAHLPTWLPLASSAPAEDGAAYASFAVKAERMAEVYQRALSSLAARYAVTLVGGSIVLPAPSVDDGRIVVAVGQPLVNASFVFGPDGALLGGPIVKAFPVAHEQPFMAAGDAAELAALETPAGRVGVLVCADAWFPAAHDALRKDGPDVVVVPQFTTGDGSWDAPWGGYNGWAAPDDVDPDDVGALTEGEAWRKYALARAHETAPVALTAPWRGQLWDLGSDGQSLSARSGEIAAAPVSAGPQVVGVWR